MSAAIVSGVIAGTLLLVVLVQLGSHNADRISNTWRNKTHMIVYLQEGTSVAAGEEIAQTLERLPGVRTVTHISQAAAAEHITKLLGKRADVFATVGSEMLPASVEIEFDAGLQKAAEAHPIVEKLRRASAVEEIAFVEDPKRKNNLLQILAQLRGLILAAFTLIALYTATITMRFYNDTRSQERSVMQLLGASSLFVRLPIAIEGVVLGLLAGSGAILVSWGLFAIFSLVTSSWLNQTHTISLCFLPSLHIVALLALSAGIGFVASLLAIRGTRSHKSNGNISTSA